MSFGLSEIRQIAVTVHDIGRAVAFYRDKLGMKHLFSVPPKMAFFDCNGIMLMLSLPETEEFDHASSIIYFGVEDIHEATRVLTDRGVEFREQPAFVADMRTYELWMSSFADSEGNTLAMRSEVQKNPESRSGK